MNDISYDYPHIQIIRDIYSQSYPIIIDILNHLLNRKVDITILSQLVNFLYEIKQNSEVNSLLINCKQESRYINSYLLYYKIALANLNDLLVNTKLKELGKELPFNSNSYIQKGNKISKASKLFLNDEVSNIVDRLKLIIEDFEMSCKLVFSNTNNKENKDNNKDIHKESNKDNDDKIIEFIAYIILDLKLPLIFDIMFTNNIKIKSKLNKQVLTKLTIMNNINKEVICNDEELKAKNDLINSVFKSKEKNNSNSFIVNYIKNNSNGMSNGNSNDNNEINTEDYFDINSNNNGINGNNGNHRVFNYKEIKNELFCVIKLAKYSNNIDYIRKMKDIIRRININTCPNYSNINNTNICSNNNNISDLFPVNIKYLSTKIIIDYLSINISIIKLQLKFPFFFYTNSNCNYNNANNNNNSNVFEESYCNIEELLSISLISTNDVVKDCLSNFSVVLKHSFIGFIKQLIKLISISKFDLEIRSSIREFIKDIKINDVKRGVIVNRISCLFNLINNGNNNNEDGYSNTQSNVYMDIYKQLSGNLLLLFNIQFLNKVVVALNQLIY